MQKKNLSRYGCFNILTKYTKLDSVLRDGRGQRTLWSFVFPAAASTSIDEHRALHPELIEVRAVSV